MGLFSKLFGNSGASKWTPKAKFIQVAQSTQSSSKVSAASFLSAVVEGDLDSVKSILKRFPALVSVKETGGFGETALHKAVGLRNVEMVKLLLSCRADVNVQDLNYQSPFFDAVNGDREEIVKLMFACKPAVNSRHCTPAYTPLHCAKSKSVAELLIAHGADVHARTDKNAGGKTPLHEAAQNGQRDVAETLISHGAEVNARSERGMTPLAYAVNWGKKSVAELLIAKNADVNAEDKEGETILEFANGKKEKDTDLIGLLRRHGAR
jgi:ankyrin repeat protein